jgi:hypothetical protein
MDDLPGETLWRKEVKGHQGHYGDHPAFALSLFHFSGN